MLDILFISEVPRRNVLMIYLTINCFILCVVSFAMLLVNVTTNISSFNCSYDVGQHRSYCI